MICSGPEKEVRMRTHGIQTNPNAVNPYAAAAERAISAQRAKQVREKLLKRTGATEASLRPDEAYLVEKWTAPARNGET